MRSSTSNSDSTGGAVRPRGEPVADVIDSDERAAERARLSRDPHAIEPPPAENLVAHDDIDERAPSARGFPWAFVLAILVILGVEVALRVVQWPKQVPYALEIDEYHAVAAQLDRFGPADVVVLGSSCAREAIHLPTLRETIQTSAGAEVTVASYAMSGARAYDVEAVVLKVLKSPRRPKLILWGVADRDFTLDNSRYDQAPLFWDFSDWKRAWATRGVELLNDFPTVIRNHLGEAYRTLQYRNQIRLRLLQLVTGEESFPAPPQGDLTVWQRFSSRKNLANSRPPAEQTERFLKPLNRFPDPEMIAALGRVSDLCRNAGVPLIVFEVPMAPPYVAGRPPAARNWRLAIFKGINNPPPFVRLEDLSFTSGEEDYREALHMSDAGARRFTRTLGEQIAAPALQDK